MQGDFSTSLVREKIVFLDDADVVQAEGAQGPATVRSNRIFLKLGARAATEKVVVRAQNMHTTLRLASRVMTSYYRNGLFLDRTHAFDWEAAWESCLSNYEKDFNPDIWAAVYINGKAMFKTNLSPFVDVVEKCALLTVDNYDATMDVTESALKQIGRAMRINHSSNVAAVFTDKDDTMRCGIIHRAEGKDTTFNFTAVGGQPHARVPQALSIAGAFLEGINLRYVVKSLQDRMRRGELEKVSPEASRLRGATARLTAINRGITGFEEVYAVKYRPEKPDFFI